MEKQQKMKKRNYEEHSFRAVAEHSRDIIILVNPKGIVTYVNPAIERILGYKVKERIGESILKNVHPDNLKSVSRKIRILATDPKSPIFTGEIPLRDKKGKWHYFESVGSNLVKNNIVQTIVINHHEITERKLFEEALKRNELMFRRLFENNPAAVFLLKDRKFVEVNPSLCSTTGYSPDELIGKPVSIGYKDNKEYERAGKILYEQVSKAGKGFIEARIKRKNGELFDGLLYLCPIDPQKSNPEYVGMMIDITERKEMESALRNERDMSKAIIDSLPGLFFLVDEKYRFLLWNDNFIKITGYSAKELKKMTAPDFYKKPEEQNWIAKEIHKTFINGENTGEADVISKDGTVKTFFFSAKKLNYKNRPCILSIAFDITEQKRSENELKRFAESLEDANIALRVLMNKRNEDQKEFEEKLQVNINDLVVPYLAKMSKGPLDERNKNYLSVLENNLTNILSPFMKDFRSSHKNLTPHEIQVVDLILKGKNTKEIAGMLNASANTIATHRNNIRKKLSLRNSKINLRSYIMSLQ